MFKWNYQNSDVFILIILVTVTTDEGSTGLINRARYRIAANLPSEWKHLSFEM